MFHYVQAAWREIIEPYSEGQMPWISLCCPMVALGPFKFPRHDDVPIMFWCHRCFSGPYQVSRMSYWIVFVLRLSQDAADSHSLHVFKFSKSLTYGYAFISPTLHRYDTTTQGHEPGQMPRHFACRTWAVSFSHSETSCFVTFCWHSVTTWSQRFMS